MLNCKLFIVGILWGLATVLGCRAPALAAEVTSRVTATIGIDHIPLAVNDLTRATNATLAVWIAGRDQPQILALFKACGARIEQKQVYVPDPLLATVATVANGEVVFLPVERQIMEFREPRK